MKKIKHLRCSKCGKTFDEDVMYHCDECGPIGTLDVVYDNAFIERTLTKNYLINNNRRDIWRYMPILPLEGERGISPLQVGWTPLYKAERLEKLLGVRNIYIKDDGRNPTASFKDRASAIGVAKAIELNKKIICAASTGNAASSLSGFAACMGIENYIFVPANAPEAKITQLLIYGSNVILVDGDYDTAFDFCTKAVDKFGWYNRSCAINPYLVEGKKTAAFEICEQLNFDVPDKVIMAVGDGCSISAVWKGFEEFYALGLIKKVPKMVSVQAEGANPVNRAFRSGKKCFDYVTPNTIADSISVGIPRNGYKALNCLTQSKGIAIDVSDEEILNAMTCLARFTGVFGEPAGVTAFAGLVKLIKNGEICSNESIALIVSGNGLKDIKSAMKAVIKPDKMKPDLEQLSKYIKSNEK
ncbi:threonine synthase [Clostridium omnivorum]|uniref:Threonine synthase n=1 Tax=Clostridium omnivorum TaxID=1604902 RepID=A0ABQ5N0N5_9CLOT|nr:threonine synthase [Clostridium sp. E14]GLC28770.1 threonine synthase [Clostridium sp. E14]